MHTIQEGYAPLFIAKETQKFRKPQLDSSPIQKRSSNPEKRDRSAPRYAHRSTGRSHLVDRSGDHVQPRVHHASQLTGRSTELPCARLCTSIDQAVDRPHCGPDISAVLAPFSLLLTSDLCTMFPDEFKKLHHSIVSPLSLHYGHCNHFSNNF